MLLLAGHVVVVIIFLAVLEFDRLRFWLFMILASISGILFFIRAPQLAEPELFRYFLSYKIGWLVHALL